MPIIYMITPTYTRPTQKADLMRLCFALMHIPMLHWIIVEDSDTPTNLVKRVLSGENSCKIARTAHLNLRTAEKLRLGKNEGFWHKCRGAEQRNHGINWVFESASKGFLSEQPNSAKVEGVVYFGDDDNTYDIQVFKEVCVCVCVQVEPLHAGSLRVLGIAMDFWLLGEHICLQC